MLEPKRAAFFQKHHHLFAPFMVQKRGRKKAATTADSNGKEGEEKDVVMAECNGSQHENQEKEKGGDNETPIQQPKVLSFYSISSYHL